MAKNDDGHQVISGDDDVMCTEKQMIVEKCNNSARTLQNVPPKKRWTSALRVVTAMARFKHMSKHQHHDGGDGTGMNAQTGTSRTASSSFSGSNESMPTNSGSRNGETATEQESESNIDPVYLALKQATEKYGSRGANNSRRSSQLIAAGESTTPSSTRNLSQASLLDSGTFSCSGEVCSGYGGSTTSSNLMTGGSTPQLQAGHQPSTPTTASRGHTKLTEKMKSFSLDCAEPPSHLQGGSGGGVFPHHRMKPLRSARAFTTGAGSLDHCAERSTSPANNYFARRPPRRLPSVPGQQQQQQQTVAVQQQPIQSSIAIPQILHIVTHEYIGGVACSLRPGERLVVVDNGDPDWKHGFKLNYCSEKLLTFPSACIAAYKTEEEQPMRVTQTCNLVDQKMRLYRDQVVFVQPNSLAEDGRVTVRNEHDKFVQCPLQFLVLA